MSKSLDPNCEMDLTSVIRLALSLAKRYPNLALRDDFSRRRCYGSFRDTWVTAYRLARLERAWRQGEAVKLQSGEYIYINRRDLPRELDNHLSIIAVHNPWLD